MFPLLLLFQDGSKWPVLPSLAVGCAKSKKQNSFIFPGEPLELICRKQDFINGP